MFVLGKHYEMTIRYLYFFYVILRTLEYGIICVPLLYNEVVTHLAFLQNEESECMNICTVLLYFFRCSGWI